MTRATLTAQEIETLRERATRAISPLLPADRRKTYLMGDTRTDAGRALPPYYLVYFLLVELLRFPHHGQWEKVAWAVPLDYKGHFASIEHRKMGLGVFSATTSTSEEVAKGIAEAVNRGVKAAAPFFDYMAAEAVASSQLNVRNNSGWLFARYIYLRDQYRQTLTEAQARKGEVTKKPLVLRSETRVVSYSYPVIDLRRQASWLGTAAVEAFFSWTEHVLIHVAILTGRIKTGQQVADLAAANWSDKVKAAMDLTSKQKKATYEKLLTIRRQVRNYIAHGAFGKQGEAFQFHSGAGAVPVNLTNPSGVERYFIGYVPSLSEEDAITTAEQFIKQLWSGRLAPAKLYIMDAGLPAILTLGTNDTYRTAMRSVARMKDFVDYLTHEMDNATNMDW